MTTADTPTLAEAQEFTRLALRRQGYVGRAAQLTYQREGPLPPLEAHYIPIAVAVDGSQVVLAFGRAK